jgi:hypothetical protein
LQQLEADRREWLLQQLRHFRLAHKLVSIKSGRRDRIRRLSTTTR